MKTNIEKKGEERIDEGKMKARRNTTKYTIGERIQINKEEEEKLQ